MQVRTRNEYNVTNSSLSLDELRGLPPKSFLIIYYILIATCIDALGLNIIILYPDILCWPSDIICPSRVLNITLYMLRRTRSRLPISSWSNFLYFLLHYVWNPNHRSLWGSFVSTFRGNIYLDLCASAVPLYCWFPYSFMLSRRLTAPWFPELVLVKRESLQPQDQL